MLQFSDLNLDEKLQVGISEVGFKEATRIQELSLPTLLEGKDLIGVSKTGTGKTAAFLIPILQILAEQEESLSSGNPKALILAPTRELAIQISEEADKLANQMKVRTVAVYGGEKYRQQQEELKSGCDLVVGTPGRLIDYFKQKKLNFSEIRFLVVDEADRLFDLGFKDDLKFLMRVAGKNRQTALFSATMELRVKMLAYQYMKDPVEVTASVDDLLTVKEVTQKVYHISRAEKFEHLLYFLKTLDWERIIVFCNTRHMTTELSRRLNNMGYQSRGISSLLQQDKRRKLISDFREGKYSILVATDLASRGIDVENISCVFNYDISDDVETYVHRIGRTARAGKEGLAINLVGPEDSENFMKVEQNYLKTKIPIDWLEEDDLKPIRDEIKLKDKPPPRKARDVSRKDSGKRARSDSQQNRGKRVKKHTRKAHEDCSSRKENQRRESQKRHATAPRRSSSDKAEKHSGEKRAPKNQSFKRKKIQKGNETQPLEKSTMSSGGVMGFFKKLLGISSEKIHEKPAAGQKKNPKGKGRNNFKRRTLK